MLWVLRGKVAAGAMNFRTYSALAAGHENDLNVLHETAAIPRHVVSHRPNLRPGLVERIRDILIRMDQSAEGRKILDGFDETRKFDDIPEETMKRLSGAQDFIDAEFRTP
jgi:phosphonate transport system substrate-binding protein